MKKNFKKYTMIGVITTTAFASVATAITVPLVMLNSKKEVNIKELALMDGEASKVIKFVGENGKGKLSLESKDNDYLVKKVDIYTKDGELLNGDLLKFEVIPKNGFKLSKDSKKYFTKYVSGLREWWVGDTSIGSIFESFFNEKIFENEDIKKIGNFSFMPYDDGTNVLVKFSNSHKNLNLQFKIKDKASEKEVHISIGYHVQIDKPSDNGSPLISNEETVISVKKITDKEKKDIEEILDNKIDFKLPWEKFNKFLLDIKSVYFTKKAIRDFTHEDLYYPFNFDEKSYSKENISEKIKEKIIDIIDLEARQKAINESEYVKKNLKTFIKKDNIKLKSIDSGNSINVKFSFKDKDEYIKIVKISNFT